MVLQTQLSLLFTAPHKTLVILGFFVAFALNANAQHSTPKANADSTASRVFRPNADVDELYFPDSKHSPTKAWVRSAIIPGWGQVYNNQWWKVPLIYVGFGFLGRAIVNSRSDYNLYLNEAIARRDSKARNPVFKRNTSSANEFFSYASNSERNYQISILGVVAVWGINCIDAYISAKFIHSYSVDNNFSLRLSPGVMSQPTYAATSIPQMIPALKISLGL
jgi:hypothetical protein